MGIEYGVDYALKHQTKAWEYLFRYQTFLTSFKPIYTLKFETNISKDLI